MKQKIDKIYIYAIYFPTSNKYYIGVTNNLQGRMLYHLESDYLVGRALRKYDDWQVSILHIRIDKEEAKILEIENIRNFSSIHPNGYNQTRGGDGFGSYWKGRKRSKENNENNRQAQLGKKLSEETKEKIRSYKHTKEAKEKIRQVGKRPCSKETKEKIRQALQGKKRPDIAKRNMGNKYGQSHIYKPSKKSGIKRGITCLKKAIKKLEEKGE